MKTINNLFDSIALNIKEVRNWSDTNFDAYYADNMLVKDGTVSISRLRQYRDAIKDEHWAKE